MATVNMANSLIKGEEVKYPMYNKESICIKCGSKEVNSNYHSENCQRNFTSDTACHYVEEEHMLRVCTNCRFEWLESPLDAKGDE